MEVPSAPTKAAGWLRQRGGRVIGSKIGGAMAEKVVTLPAELRYHEERVQCAIDEEMFKIDEKSINIDPSHFKRPNMRVDDINWIGEIHLDGVYYHFAPSPRGKVMLIRSKWSINGLIW